MFPIGWREILQQFDFVPTGCFYGRELDLSAFDSSDFFCHFTSLMRSMRKFEAEDVSPEFQ